MAIFLKQVKPEPGVTLMGLEKEDLSVFPGCISSFEIPIINGKFNIGLDGEENQKLRQKFENYFGVDFDSDAGRAFLSDYELSVNHDITSYDPNNTKHLFDLHIIRVNNGMGVIAPSEIAIEQTPINTFKFVLSDENTELEEKVRKQELKYQAITELSKLYEGNGLRLLLVAKYIFNAGSGLGSNKTLAFAKLSEFVERNLSNCQKFLEVIKLDPEYMDTVVKVKESIYRNIIRYHNGQYVLYSTQTPLGRNEEEVIKYCTNPANKDIVGYGMDDDLPTSISAQLKNFD